tara:strand:+ start:391 stop:645 length:255 start_codon:yes stop_codon:yes gene_type:complete
MPAHDPYDKKYKAVRLASRIFASVLCPVGHEDWQMAYEKTEKALMKLAEQILEEQANSPERKRKEKKATLLYLREQLKKNKNNP